MLNVNELIGFGSGRDPFSLRSIQSAGSLVFTHSLSGYGSVLLPTWTKSVIVVSSNAWQYSNYDQAVTAVYIGGQSCTMFRTYNTGAAEYGHHASFWGLNTTLTGTQSLSVTRVVEAQIGSISHVLAFDRRINFGYDQTVQTWGGLSSSIIGYSGGLILVSWRGGDPLSSNLPTTHYATSIGGMGNVSYKVPDTNASQTLTMTTASANSWSMIGISMAPSRFLEG